MAKRIGTGIPDGAMITTEKEGLVLFRLSSPMALSMVGAIAYNLTDTFFVARLGSLPLAALSFTFPVVLAAGSIAHGLGVGLTSAVSRAVGAGDRTRRSLAVFWGLVLALFAAALIAVPGLFTMAPLFALLGADNSALVLIRGYMEIWYPGVIFMIIPMAGNAVIMGLGDTRTPARIMITAILVNLVLDPVLIFGLGPLPGLGVSGAALATVLARGLSFFWIIRILAGRRLILRPVLPSLSRAASVITEILMMALPNMLTRLILPAVSGLVTAMVAAHGSLAVAGLGIAVRLELFACLALSALVAALPVFIGQNFGAGEAARISRGMGLATKFCLAYGVAVYPVLLILGPGMIQWISGDSGVLDSALAYLGIVPLAYGMMGVMQISATCLNVLNHPLQSAALSLIQAGLYLSLAWIGSERFGLSGIFGSLALSYFGAGMIGNHLGRQKITALIRSRPGTGPPLLHPAGPSGTKGDS